MVNGVRINCSKVQGHGHQTLAEAVQNSCNPAFMMIGQRLGAEKFYDYFEAFGMTEVTGSIFLARRRARTGGGNITSWRDTCPWPLPPSASALP